MSAQPISSSTLAVDPAAASGKRCVGLEARVRTMVWVAALCLLTIGLSSLGYTRCVVSAEILIFGLLIAGIVRRGVRRTPLDLLIAAWLIGEALATARAYAMGWGAHSPYTDDLYAGGTFGPAQLLIDCMAGFAAYYAASWSAPAECSPARKAAPVLVAAAGVAALCVVEQARNHFFGTSDPRIQATFTNPNLLGSFLCLTLPLSAAAAAERGFRKPARIACGLLGATLLGALVLTQSRGAILGCVIGFAYLCAVLWTRGARGPEAAARRGKVVLKVFAAGCIAIVALGLALFPHLMKESRTVSDNQREVTWHAAALLIESHPLLGIGTNAFPAAMQSLHLLQLNSVTSSGLPLEPAVHLHAHDLLLQSWVERGALGALTTLAFILLVLRRARELLTSPNRASSMIAAGAAAGVLAWLAQNVSDYTLWFAPIALLLWYILSLMFSAE